MLNEDKEAAMRKVEVGFHEKSQEESEEEKGDGGLPPRLTAPAQVDSAPGEGRLQRQAMERDRVAHLREHDLHAHGDDGENQDVRHEC